jgi:hypothetical protein
METRLYFLAGDAFSCALTGALAGAVCVAIIPQGWHMLAAMAIGMIAGMTLSIPLSIVLGILFGAMELMIPVMLTGMAAGMVLAMEVAGQPLGFFDAAVRGAAIGVLSLVATSLANAALCRSRTV